MLSLYQAVTQHLLKITELRGGRSAGELEPPPCQPTLKVSYKSLLEKQLECAVFYRFLPTHASSVRAVLFLCLASLMFDVEGMPSISKRVERDK